MTQTDEDNDAIAQAIESAGGIETLVEQQQQIESQLPMTLRRVQATLTEDLADFDAEKVCWNCATWTLFNKKVGPHEGCGLGVMPALLSCGGCRQAWYCSRECQQEDWEKHRTACRQEQRLAAKKRSSTGDVLQAGDLVTVHGLKGAQQHNGKQGVVQEFDGEKARFVVKLDGEKLLAIKPENLRRAGGEDKDAETAKAGA